MKSRYFGRICRRMAAGMVALLTGLAFNTQAQNVADSMDVLHYDLTIDFGCSVPRQMTAHATLRIVALSEMDTATLDLEGVQVDGVNINGDSCGYRFDNRYLCIPVAGRVTAGDTFSVAVSYRSTGYVEQYGFGGLHMDNALYYNLGAGIMTDPHAMGRAIMPCRDNFHDKATYRLSVTTAPQWQSLCSGRLTSKTEHIDGSTTAVWLVEQEIPTYILSLSAAPFQMIYDTVEGDAAMRAGIGKENRIPLHIGYQNYEESRVRSAFALMHDVVPAFERLFGPYRWGTIGYIGTPRGSMEHANNIHLANSCMTATTPDGQSTTVHEFAHAWFGNLVTCETADDMWINEGGATFSEAVGLAAAYGDSVGDEYFRNKMDRAMRTAHRDDGGWHALYAPTWQNVYGTTVYQKGACVWHGMKGYLGDSLFYGTLRTFFDRNAFTAIGSQRLCDSLSAISGVNLQNFFDFHVFAPGFQDFDVEALQPAGSEGQYTLALRQTLRGTEVLGRRSRVPITFFDRNLQSHKQTIAVAGDYEDAANALSHHSVQLPFEPAFAVVDLDKETGLAGNSDTVTFAERGSYELPLCHFSTNVQRIGDSTLFLALTHHFTAPHTPAEQIPGIVRTAERYWTVTGLLPSDSRLYGFFHYNNSSMGDDAYLDENLLHNVLAFDSLYLLYRATPDAPWSLAGQRVNGNASSGSFVTMRLRKGEYTLGIVDTARLSIAQPKEETDVIFTVRPNPAKDHFTIEFTVESAMESFSVELRDTKGNVVLQQARCRNGEIIAVDTLPKGMYFLTLRNTKRKEQTFYENIIVI